MTKDIFDHLKTTYKIRERAADGDMGERFVKTDDNDHRMRALNYSTVAQLVVEEGAPGEGSSEPPMVGKMMVGSTAANQTVDTQASLRNLLKGRVGWWRDTEASLPVVPSGKVQDISVVDELKIFGLEFPAPVGHPIVHVCINTVPLDDLDVL